jgi:hypothetical protein
MEMSPDAKSPAPPGADSARSNRSTVDKVSDHVRDGVVSTICWAILAAAASTIGMHLVKPGEILEDVVSKTVPLTLAVLLVVRAFRAGMVRGYSAFLGCLLAALVVGGLFTHVFCTTCEQLGLNVLFDPRNSGFLGALSGYLKAYARMYGAESFCISVLAGAVAGWQVRTDQGRKAG